MTTAQESIDTRVPGIVLIASSVVAVVAMAHHPAPSGADFAAWARNVERMGALNEAVHGTMISLVGVLTWALSAFAIRRGVHRSLVTLGLVAWATAPIHPTEEVTCVVSAKLEAKRHWHLIGALLDASSGSCS